MRAALAVVALPLLALIPTPALAQNPATPSADKPSADRPTPGYVRVRLDTQAGAITIALDQRRAPITTANFLAYVDDGRFAGVTFYRVAKRKGDPKHGFIQAGIRGDARRALPPIRLEPTSQTGIRHLDATISMARDANPNSAMGNFTMTLGANPSLDAKPGNPGYAAFGRVVGGMEVMRRILAMPTGGGTGMMRGQMLLKPVTIVRAVRLDGRPQPTGRIKPWLIIHPLAK